MKLTHVRVTAFRSVLDSGTFDVGDITCLVGKNEAGKTAVLRALHRLNPLDETAGTFSVTDDYPRATVSDYERDVSSGKRAPARVVTATFELSAAERQLVEEEFGAQFLKSNVLTLSRGYEDKLWVTLEHDEAMACGHLVELAEMPATSAATFAACTSLELLQAALATATEDEHVKRLGALVEEISAARGFMLAAFNRHLASRVPKFLYFDEFYQMIGHENIDALKQRVAQKKLRRSDHPLLGLVELANLTLDDLVNPTRTLDLKNRLEGAGNKLSSTILKYWSQNRHIRMRFDVREARPEDPENMRSGTNLWAEVYDSKHLATTLVGERSRGFVWFFSFLAWYAQQQGKSHPIILLLDEPGLTLHGAAQGDLLRYIEEELGQAHQVIYSTHSPFMVDATKLERVRIVQDRSMEEDNLPPEDEGTKAFTDVLRASPGSLFPLHGALGFEVQQTLFIGPYTLIVEGVSDLLYIQTMTGVLERLGRVGLDARWIIAPVGGIDKVPAFAALFGAQKTLAIATLIDLQARDTQTIENLYKERLLEKKNVLTYAKFTGAKEADAEDMFGDDFYVELVNGEFKAQLAKPIVVKALPKGGPRVLPRLERHLETAPLASGARFNHYRPARFLAENVGQLEPKLPPEALDRFEAAFKALDALLK
jgi:predicted ATP-dependent endonuclease of OLD family